jgi:hypothetical protein
VYSDRSFLGLKWRYVPEHLAVLLDKIYKFENKTYELGGEAAQAVSIVNTHIQVKYYA